MIIEAANGFLRRAVPPSRIVELDTTQSGFDRELWRQMCDLGWTAMGVPEPAGGLGSIVDLCLVCEENGRVALSSPLVTTVAAGALPLAASGRPVDELLSGARIATMALLEEGSASEWSPPHLTGARSEDGWTLSGRKILVPWANVADVFVFSCYLEDRGPSLATVPRDALSILDNEILGGDRRSRVELDGIAIDESDLLDYDLLAHSLDVQTVLNIALAVGLCDQALSLSVQYANERHQFGKPIGAFQAVSYRIVDMKLAVDAARLFCHKAAWHLDVGRAASLHVGAAKAYANEMIDICTHNAHQVHGAMGFSTEYDLHLFTRRARALACNHGTTSRSLERVAVGLGLGPGTEANRVLNSGLAMPASA
jgi:alkylation response protein AidB-like acyl-CoA dehydrogenase